MVMLQSLDVRSSLAGSTEKALELATSLQARAVAGEDFTKLVDDYGYNDVPGSHGIVGPFELAKVKLHPDIGSFMSDSRKVGDISPPLPVRLEGELRGYRVLKIVELKTTERPQFALRETQNKLHQTIENRILNFRRDRGLSALLDAAYVWPPEAFGRAKAGAQTP
jgi:hypothetical protein